MDNGFTVSALSARGGSYRPLIRVRGSHAIACKILGPVNSWLVHWDDMDKRTVPCILGDCPQCKKFATRRPMSYVAVQHLISREGLPVWTPSVLEVPLSTGLRLCDARGAIVGLKRLRPRGAVEVHPFGSRTSPPAMEAFDVVPPLLRLWRLPASVKLRLLDPCEWEMWSVAGE